ncbi:MAG: AI-2E family transporter [Chloroflexi bacterium]|nr:AI-2E family transporter [Chloroflexota bacterium]MBV9893359.1 AI-2E family transporter [Chloroflexota bacterium]
MRDPWLRALSILGCAIAGIYLVGLLWQVIQEFSDIILLFFLAWLVAFVLEPVVSTLVESRVPRLPAIGLTYLTLLVLFSLGVILLVPALSLQVVEVARNLPTYVEQATALLNGVQATANDWLTGHGSPVLVDLKSALDPQELSRRADALGPPILSNAIGLATGAATLLVQVVIMLILSFYFMVDGARLADSFIMALPLRAQDDARFLVASIHRAFAGFLRGQMIQAVLGGVGTGLLMSVLQVDYALLSSVVAALVLLIPFVGPVVAVVLPVTIALLTHPDAAVYLFVALLALQQVLFNVLAPRILSQQIGLHPLLVFFAVLAGARVAGVWGAIFGVPIVAVVTTMTSFYRASHEERAARLLEHLPAEELVSVDLTTSQESDAELMPSGAGGKGVARS